MSRALIAGGFSRASAISFVSAFALISIGIALFSFASYDYAALPQQDEGEAGSEEFCSTAGEAGIAPDPKEEALPRPTPIADAGLGGSDDSRALLQSSSRPSRPNIRLDNRLKPVVLELERSIDQ